MNSSILKEKPFQVGHIVYNGDEKYYDEKRWADTETDSDFISPTSRNWSVQLEIGAPPAWNLRKPQRKDYDRTRSSKM